MDEKTKIENDRVFFGMLLDAISNILDGGDPSDFEMSFGIVRRVMELKIELEDYRRRT